MASGATGGESRKSALVSGHLLVAISSHGYGHAAQAAPVVARLAADHPGLVVSLASALPSALLRELYGPAVKLVPPFDEVAMAMASPLDVLADDSAAAYAALHAHWEFHLARAGRRLGELACDLVLADVPYLPLAAAARVGVAGMALSSLNWADIYRAYCADAPGAGEVLGQILAAYRAAEGFIACAPALAMPDLDTRPVGPIARLGRNRRAALNDVLGLEARDRLVLVNLGGIGAPVDAAGWPVTAGWRWILPRGMGAGRDDAHGLDALGELGFAFIDLLRSADAFVTKPGYGGVVEAGCNGVPVLYVPRGDWPEEPGLIAWLRAAVPAAEIGRDALAAGALAEPLENLLAQPRPDPPAPTGIEEAASLIAPRLGI